MFFFGGIGVCQACICVVPGLIMWYGMRLCFEIFFGECGCVDSSVQWVFRCHWPCGCTHVVFALWVVPNVPCLYLVRSVNWGGLCCCVLC